MLVLPYRRSKTDYDTPAMKVFTVGLDQKPPIKSPDSPPPGYPSPTPPAGIKMPLPLGPEVAPVIVRKSRGYKGILMVMLAVFLMGLFALTLSEIAYNRQRDENFFRLRWAELKHRMGYPEPPNYEYYRRLDANRIYELNRNKEMAEALVQQPQESSTSTTVPPQPEQMVIDSESRQQSGSQEQDQAGLVRDARLQFLRTILQKIKKHAEEMGLEGTMQVSVIEMEPQQVSVEDSRAAGGKQQPQPRLPFMPHDPKSDSFLDGFGEYHQPTFMENNQIAEQNRQRAFGPWPREQESSQDVDFPGRHGHFRPDEMSFRPFRPEWAMPPRPFGGEHNEIEQPPMPPMGVLGPIVEPPMPQQKVFELERPQEIVGEMYGRKFGRMLQDLIASRLQGMQQMQMNPLIPQRPSFPIENSIVPQQGQQQQQGPPMMPPNTWWQQPPPQWQRQIGQGVDFFPQPPQNQQQQPQGGPQQQQQMPQVVFFPPPPPPVQPQQMQQQSQEQQPQVPQQAQQFPQPQNLIPPEDRIQIEPPNQGGPKIQGVIAPEFRPWPEAGNAEPKQQKEEKMNNEGPRGWTHQEQVAPAMEPPVVPEQLQMPEFNPAVFVLPRPVHAFGINGAGSKGDDEWMIAQAPPAQAPPPNWVPLPMPGDLNIHAGRVTGEAGPALVDRDTDAPDAQKQPEKKESEKPESEKSEAEKPQKPETVTEEEDSSEPLEMVQTPVVSGGSEGAAPSSDEEKWKQLLAKAAMENAQRQQQSRLSTLPLQEAAIQINPLPSTVELHPAVMTPRIEVVAEKQSESQEPKEAPVKGEAVPVEFPKFRVEATKEVEPVQVDFPAVKLPLPAMNDGEAMPQEQPEVVLDGPRAEAPPPQPHEQQHDSPMVQSNPIFFQVDEPQPFAAAKA